MSGHWIYSAAEEHRAVKGRDTHGDKFAQERLAEREAKQGPVQTPVTDANATGKGRNENNDAIDYFAHRGNGGNPLQRSSYIPEVVTEDRGEEGDYAI